ncbi:MAG: iron-containing alcohol dehydrogenase [Treponema sp.]|jgi:alcohol dehydrogenase|nr:iron-containing alcohol dehydrogenase [Treponema sp.]
MLDVSFRLDPELIIGMDTVSRAGTICRRYGKRALLVTEHNLHENKKIERLVAILEDSGIETIVYDEIPAQAKANAAEKAAILARDARCSAIIAFGGLAVQAMGRIAAISANSGAEIPDLLEGKIPEDNFLPYIAVPTALRDPFLFSSCFAAVDPRDRQIKLISSPRGLCVGAIIDGGLSEPLGEAVSSSFALDGLCISVEAYCSGRAGILSDAFLEQAIPRYTRILQRYEESRFDGLEEEMACAGVLMALGAAASAPGIGTALAYAINSRFPVDKSRCAAVLFPHVLDKLIAARPERIAKVAVLMGEPAAASAAETAALAAASVRRRMETLKVPARLQEFGLSLDRLVSTAEAARGLGFIAFSPWAVAAEDAFELLKAAL